MNKNKMLEALSALDSILDHPAKLLLGGGGAMVLAYEFPLATHDLDAIFYKSDVTLADLNDQIIQIGADLGIPGDWINPHFETFLYTLPEDYESRLKTIFEGKNLTVNALSLEDLLVLKCFAGREKDIPHARALIKKGADVDFAESHIHKMLEKGIPKSEEARDFLEDLLDE